jgi:hypothetical protein
MGGGLMQFVLYGCQDIYNDITQNNIYDEINEMNILISLFNNLSLDDP